MGMWICVLAAVALGAFAGGKKAVQYARSGDYAGGSRIARKGALAAAGFAMLGTTLFFGWPFKSSTISVGEEVTRTVIETVEVPFLFFWSRHQSIPRQITETIFHSAEVDEFSPWLLLPMLLVGAAAYRLELWLIRLAWVWRG